MEHARVLERSFPPCCPGGLLAAGLTASNCLTGEQVRDIFSIRNSNHVFAFRNLYPNAIRDSHAESSCTSDDRGFVFTIA